MIPRHQHDPKASTKAKDAGGGALVGPEADGEGDELRVLLDELPQLLVVGILGCILLEIQSHTGAPRQIIARVLPDLQHSWIQSQTTDASSGYTLAQIVA